MQVTLKSDDQPVQFWKGGVGYKSQNKPKSIASKLLKYEVAQTNVTRRSPPLKIAMSIWCDIHNQSAVCKEKSKIYANGQWLYNI